MPGRRDEARDAHGRKCSRRRAGLGWERKLSVGRLVQSFGGYDTIPPSDGNIGRRQEMAASNPDAQASNNGHTFGSFREIADFLWQNAERLRGTYKPNEYDKVILPLLVIRRLDCVLAPTKQKVLDRLAELKARRMKESDPAMESALKRRSGLSFFNTSKLDFGKLRGDPDHVAQNIRSYLKGFSSNARDVIEQFKFDEQISRLDEANLLYQIVDLFAGVNLHPDQVPNHVMGSVFEELIRRFNEKKNEEAGDHYTPRDIIRLMVDLLFYEDDDVLRKPGIVRTLFDPACGTGGMLSVSDEYLRSLNPDARLELFGQELNAETYAVCKSDMIIKGQNPENIVRGNSFDSDGHRNARFDYMLSNPPFGIDWKNVQKVIEDERDTLGFGGRFGPGLPRVSDGALLFLLHMLSKMKPVETKTREGGSRIAIVLNGSPLFTGDAGSGESEIRRWIIENDWLEAIVALPLNMFYNTGIATYIWVLTNRKPVQRKGKVQLIDATQWYRPLRKNLGKKNCEFSAEDIERICDVFLKFEETEQSKLFPYAAFGYWKVTVERPLRMRGVDPERIYSPKEIKTLKDTGQRAEEAQPVIKKICKKGTAANPLRGLFETTIKGKPAVVEYEPDTELRDTEQVPLLEDGGIDAFLRREVLPYAPDAWYDPASVKIGYEISFNRYFYKPRALRSLEEIRADLLAVEKEAEGLLGEILGGSEQ